MSESNRRLPSTTRHDFSRVPHAEIPRSSFDRSCGNKLTFDSGYLIPFFVDEVLPGDTFNVKTTAFGRLATPLHPFMDNLFMETQYFFVPNRLVWDNWAKFNGEQENPGDSTDYVIPTMTSPAGGYVNSSIHDYFGIPPEIEGIEHSALWHRAYNLIYNQWYRSEDLIDSVPVPKGDGPDSPSDYKILRRGKRHDYFTSGLPWPQKGPAVPLPVGGEAPITGLGADAATPYAASGNVVESTGNTVNYVNAQATNTSNALLWEEDPDNPGQPHIFASLADASASTVNQLRQAFAVQKLLERDARGGTRYTEIIRAHFGVTSPDMRLQRPEFLGGGASIVNVNPVAQTSSTDATTPQGNLAATGTLSVNHNGFVQSFTEHGMIIGIISLRADLTYQQGLPRMFSRSTRYDFYWPALSHIGEQSILNQELYVQGTAGGLEDGEVFAYQERWAEYRYKPSQISAQFRSSYAQTLDSWHLAQNFLNLPTLGEQFIEENPPVERVIAVPSEPQVILDTYTAMKCARPMPVNSVPGLIDHF